MTSERIDYVTMWHDAAGHIDCYRARFCMDGGREGICGIRLEPAPKVKMLAVMSKLVRKA